MSPLDKPQRIQERRYAFPYHYLPRLENGDFSPGRAWEWGCEYLSYVRFVLARLEALSFQSLLDVGCGDGRFLLEVRARFPRKELVGIDYSEPAICYARALCPDVEFRCEKFGAGPVPQRQFDVVTLIETLEHIPVETVADFVKHLHACLAPGGVLIVTVPSTNVPVGKKHYQHFDLPSLVRSLEPCFVVFGQFHLNKISRWARFLQRLMVNKVFVLNQRRLLNLIFRHYEKRLAVAAEHTARRICVLCRRVDR